MKEIIFLIEVKRKLKRNILMSTNFLSEQDNLLKSRSQILWIKELNLEDFKFNYLISFIDKGDFLRWRWMEEKALP